MKWMGLTYRTCIPPPLLPLMIFTKVVFLYLIYAGCNNIEPCYNFKYLLTKPFWLIRAYEKYFIKKKVVLIFELALSYHINCEQNYVKISYFFKTEVEYRHPIPNNF